MTGLEEKNSKLRTKNRKKLQDKPEFIKEWYYYLRSCNISENTCNDYLNKILRFLDFMDNDIYELTRQDVINYMAGIMEVGDGRNSSDSYKQCVWSALNNFLDFCYNNGYVKENYMSYIARSKNNDLERIKKNRISITEDDYRNIIKCVKEGVGTNKAKKIQEEMLERNLTIFLLLMTTGMRKSALCQINVSDVDIDNSTLFVTDKNNKSFNYTISGETMKYLYLWIKKRESYNPRNDALFITKNGERLSGSALDKMVDKYCTPIIGKHMSPHKFRGGFCSQVFGKTGNIEFTRRAVGHSNLSTTQRYITTDNKEMKKASGIMNDIFNIEGGSNI